MEHSVQSQQVLAAVDLGSNSFHMVMARLINGQLQIIDQRGEKVQLAAGLHPINGMADDAQERALACLERFGQHLRGLDPHLVTILGTNTLRAARNSYGFMQKAKKVLGFPIEVISGIEEARLVYLGVAHTLADDDGKRLVIDIGGGSTEFIIGERFAPLKMESLGLGCVTYTDRFFADGELTEKAFSQAIAAARRELLSIKVPYQRLGWQNVVGSSGTMRATNRVLMNYGLSEEGINLKALYALKKIVLQTKTIDKLELQGVKEQRLEVFPAGLAVLIAIFEVLEIDSITYSDGALREGALYDLIGRVNHEDVREKTVKAMQSRFVVDAAQALNVKNTAMYLYDQVADRWKVNEPGCKDALRWAADLHEVGLAIAHSAYHKHSAYLVQFCDMPGFTKQNQETLAILLRGHRKKLPIQDVVNMSKRGAKTHLRLSILLRLAVLLHFGRGVEEVVEPTIKAFKYSIKLTFPEGYLENNPMTRMDLEREKNLLEEGLYDLTFQ
ncbi:MAG: exopolyphosphatase [Bermanella sp.]|nr:exopolyphosphatase [Bermanella sp.]|tara:strand:+ start:1862 stop:3364 length:1503 start_codon:yes stop_codon:yes gene_type:complete